ncbi:MAG: RNase P subunit p30 family protein [Candidatus Hydrothermarchaeales archaeon]
MKFIDLHVHSIFSTGVDTPLRLAHHARRLDVQIGLCDSHRFEDGEISGQIKASGVEAVAKTKRHFNEALKALRNGWDYVAVPGGTGIVNRLAAGDDRVDILLHPDLGRRDSGLDTFIAREASENAVAIEVNLGGVISARGGLRIQLCRNIQRNLELSRKYGFDLIAGTGAKTRYELRSGECVYELLIRLGFTEEEAAKATYDVPQAKLEDSR